MTSAEIFRVPVWGLPKPADWRVRVIPNTFPALRIEEPIDGGTDGSLVFRHPSGCGTHLGNPDSNLTINTVPRGHEDKNYFLWHIEILPRLSTPAGFELGSGMSINTVLLEEAADYLKTIETK